MKKNYIFILIFTLVFLGKNFSFGKPNTLTAGDIEFVGINTASGPDDWIAFVELAGATLNSVLNTTAFSTPLPTVKLSGDYKLTGIGKFKQYNFLAKNPLKILCAIIRKSIWQIPKHKPNYPQYST